MWVFGGHLEKLALVGAEQDSVLTVPLHGFENYGSIYALSTFLTWHVAAVEFLYIHAPRINEVVVSAFALVFFKLTFCAILVLEGGQNSVKLHFVFREDGELILAARVELD